MRKVKIVAKKRTKCSCGEWVNLGDEILYAPSIKKTVGCQDCGLTGIPVEDFDPPNPTSFDLDLYAIYHD